MFTDLVTFLIKKNFNVYFSTLFEQDMVRPVDPSKIANFAQYSYSHLLTSVDSKSMVAFFRQQL